MLIPIVTFEEIDLATANECLERWGHKMGPLARGNQAGVHYALCHEGKPVAVAMTSTLIRERVGGGLVHLTRDNCCELSRLCAERPGLCRVALRLWREFVFPATGYDYAISYQDADLHNGNTYRFDGWERAAFARSGPDTRSGRPGRRKWVWVWKKTQPKTDADFDAVHSLVPNEKVSGAGTASAGLTQCATSPVLQAGEDVNVQYTLQEPS